MTAPLPERFEAADLVIRRWVATDVDGMGRLIAGSLDHLRPWMAWANDEPISAQSRRRLFERWDRYWLSGRGAVYAVIATGELIGGLALHRRVGPGGLDLGYWFAGSVAGRGFATRTADLVTEAALLLDDVDFVQISHSAANTRSGAVAERLGFSTVIPSDDPAVTTWRRHR